MSTGDEPPAKKPPRASWEPPDPDEAIPSPSPEPSESARAQPAWEPPPPEALPPRKKPRAETAPPRASWEAAAEPMPVEAASAPEPSVVVAEPPTSPPAPSAPVADSDDPMAPLPVIESAAQRSFETAPIKAARTPPPSFADDTDDEDGGTDDDGPRRRRGLWIAAGALIGVVGLGIGALVILGGFNKERFQIACEPQEVHAMQGRGFPPWGFRALDDEGMWKPIQIPPEAECRERETEDEAELSRWYLEILSERASALLTAREVTKIDDAAGLLEQALLHARSPDRRDQRRDIERLLGDVGYWRASARLRDAANALTEAAKQFDAAAAQRPRHVSDASAWATYVRKLVEELRAGPNGAAAASFPPVPAVPGREPAPPGVALPVEPAGSGSASTEPPPAPPDAGLPTGGVLL